MNTVETLHDFACTWCTICCSLIIFYFKTFHLHELPKNHRHKTKKRSLFLPHWYQLPHFGWKTVLMVMVVLGLWDILLPSMHRPPHLPHLPLLYLKKMCAMWINLAMMEVDYCCHHLHHATSWVDQKVCMWFKFDTTLPWTWLISTHFVEGIERK